MWATRKNMPLIIEYKIPDAARDALQKKLLAIGEAGFVEPVHDSEHQKYPGQIYSYAMNNELLGRALAKIIIDTLPPTFMKKMQSMKQGGKAYGVLLRNLPRDPIIPEAPAEGTKSLPKEKTTYISEMLLRGMASVIGGMQPEPLHYNIDYEHVVEAKKSGDISPGQHWHKDGASAPKRTDGELSPANNRALSTSTAYNLLYCLRSNPEARTYFTHQDNGIQAFTPIWQKHMKGVQSFSLGVGDLIIFNNRELLHGRGGSKIDPDNRRWVEAAQMRHPKASKYNNTDEAAGLFIDTAASIIQNPDLHKNLHHFTSKYSGSGRQK